MVQIARLWPGGSLIEGPASATWRVRTDGRRMNAPVAPKVDREGDISSTLRCHLGEQLVATRGRPEGLHDAVQVSNADLQRSARVAARGVRSAQLAPITLPCRGEPQATCHSPEWDSDAHRCARWRECGVVPMAGLARGSRL